MATGIVNWKEAQVNSSDLDVFLLGCVDFDAFLLLQDRLAADIHARRDRYGLLLLCEHPPVISIGRDGSAADLQTNSEDDEPERLPIRWVGRGGGTWKHGPAQLSVSVLVPIDRLEMSPRTFRRTMVRSVLQLAHDIRIPAAASATVPGVYGRIGQFAFVGAAVRSGVTQFGMIVNVAPAFDVTAFSPSGVRSSSLAAERSRPISMATVRESLTRHLAAGFGYEEVHIHTGHPWLRRTLQTVPLHA
jgi:lipoyl(octanoyl) transferase